MRDALLGNTPVFWMHETEYLWMCLATTVGVFFLWSYLAERGEAKEQGSAGGVDLLASAGTVPLLSVWMFFSSRHGVCGMP